MLVGAALFVSLCARAAHALGPRQRAPAPIGPQIAALTMSAWPTSPTVQSHSCGYLAGALANPETKKHHAGTILRLMALAVEKNVDDKAVFVACSGAIVSNVVFDKPMTDLLHFQVPGLTLALISGLKKYANDSSVLSRTLEHVAGMHSGASTATYTPMVYALGGFDVLYSAVNRYPDHGGVQMSAWRGFSDHAHTELGASIIANLGGFNKGIPWLMSKLRAHPEAHYGISGDSLDCHYEILQVVNGMLNHDYLNVYAPAFMKEGIFDLLAHAMDVDFDLRGTQSISCDVMNKLMMRNPTLKGKFAKHSEEFLAPVTKAIHRFKNPDNTPWGGGTFGAAYPVVPECTQVLKQVATDKDGKEKVRALVAAGFLDFIDTV